MAIVFFPTYVTFYVGATTTRGVLDHKIKIFEYGTMIDYFKNVRTLRTVSKKFKSSNYN